MGRFCVTEDQKAPAVISKSYQRFCECCLMIVVSDNVDPILKFDIQCFMRIDEQIDKSSCDRGHVASLHSIVSAVQPPLRYPPYQCDPGVVGCPPRYNAPIPGSEE
jgi:hypothetical protein